MSTAMDMDVLAREFAPLVRRVARRYEGRGAEREDLEQEGYVALIVIAQRFGRNEMALRLKRHLPGYVRDAAKKMWRPAHIVSLLCGDDDDEEGQPLAELLADGRSAEEVDELELMDALERFLPPRDMELARALAKGLTQHEIAEETGESRPAVARRVANMRKRLTR